MKIYCTYCSARKNENNALLPAIERYISSRIKLVSELAKSKNCEFRIFSGTFGLLKPEDEIPYYDHLLIEKEVVGHALFISKQIEAAGITEIEFYMVSLLKDPNVKPYFDCLELACKNEQIVLNVIVSEFNPD